MSVINRLKAPNILILTEFDNDFNSIKSFIRTILGNNSYTIYNINSTQLKKTPDILIDNCRLLVTIENNKNEISNQEEEYNFMKKYLDNGGKLLSFPSKIEIDKYKLEKFNNNNLFIYDSNFQFEFKYNQEAKESYLNLSTFIYSYNKQNHWISKVNPTFFKNDCDNRESLECKSFLKDIFYNLFTKELNLKPVENTLKPKPYNILTKSKVS
jgi:hypothetical protein